MPASHVAPEDRPSRAERARAAIDGGPGWHMDPDSLLPVLDDEARFREAHAADPAVDVLVALWSGDPDRAAAALEPLLAAEPTWWRLQALTADVARERGSVEEAVEILRELVGTHEGSPREAVLVQHLGKALFTGGDVAGAADCFHRALELRESAGADAALVESSRRALERARSLLGQA